MIRYFLLLVFINIAIVGHSQPKIIFLDENPSIKQHLISKPLNYLKTIKSASDTLLLPFFDDFAKSSIYPDTSLWTDNYAYINSNLAINPPSIGVATLDAIGNDGSLYPEANTTSFIADYLSTKPIFLKLNSPEDTTVYFSFMYQACGIGDTPEKRDSLVLEFYSPVDTIWHSVWRAEGTAVHAFKKVIIHIKDTIFLQNGFRFRFKNYASISNNTLLPGRRGNVDYWHLDWIYLNKFRNANDTIWSDVSMTKNTKSLLTKYESVPWKHYIAKTSIGNNGNLSIQFKNHSNTELNVTVKFKVEKNGTTTPTYDFNGGSVPEVFPFVTKNYHHSLISNPFTIDGADYAEFNVKSYLINDQISLTEPYRWNDTIHYLQKFHNYYAYDDGSAENGFGIDGQQTSSAKLAVRFSNYIPDTIRGIQMYFNHAFNNANEVYFYLTIWDEVNGYPGNIIYQKEGFKVNYTSDINKYYTFKLDTTIILSGNYFIGWQQTDEVFMNIGLDIDRDASLNTYWNVYGTWQPLPFAGAIMIRPIFGKPIPTGISEIIDKQYTFNIWPNPATNIININNFESNDEVFNAKIYNFNGQLIKTYNEVPSSIDVYDLKNGIYFLRLSSSEKQYSTRFIINK